MNDLRANFHCGRFIGEQRSISKNENATKKTFQTKVRGYTEITRSTSRQPRNAFQRSNVETLKCNFKRFIPFLLQICHIPINRNEDTHQPRGRVQAIKNIIFHLKTLTCPSRDVSRSLRCQIHSSTVYTSEFSLKTSFPVVRPLTISRSSQMNRTRCIYKIVAVVNV